MEMHLFREKRQLSPVIQQVLETWDCHVLDIYGVLDTGAKVGSFRSDKKLLSSASRVLTEHSFHSCRPIQKAKQHQPTNLTILNLHPNVTWQNKSNSEDETTNEFRVLKGD